MLKRITSFVRRQSEGAAAAMQVARASAEAPSKTQPRVVQREEAQPQGFRWLRMVQLKFTNEYGKEQRWEVAERTTRKGDVDAVFIVATLRAKGKEPEYLLVSQYRPPVDAYVVEFPAGLVDKGETAEQAALRELKEETGFVGSVRRVSPVLVADPGMTNANLQFVHVDVDLGLPENQNPLPDFQDGECIESHLVPQSKLLSVLSSPKTKLKRKHAAERIVVDCRVFSVAVGLDLAGRDA